MDVDIEYEGGQKMDTSEDIDEWVTDEEDPPPKEHQSNASENCGTKNIESPNDLESKPTTVKPSNFDVLDDSPSDHHFAGTTTPMSGDILRRIGKEHKILASSLPDGVFARSWEARLDLLRILIIGPTGTPYEHAPFVIDMHFSESFPASPPATYFHSWTNNAGRINPNLYEDGKICLSLLGTWPSDKSNEGWSASKSSVLQIIVSLMGLVLVKEPYYSKFSL